MKFCRGKDIYSLHTLDAFTSRWLTYTSRVSCSRATYIYVHTHTFSGVDGPVHRLSYTLLCICLVIKRAFSPNSRGLGQRSCQMLPECIWVMLSAYSYVSMNASLLWAT